MAAGGMGAMPQQSGQAGGMPQQPPMMPQVQRPQMPQQFGQSPFMGGGFNPFMGRGMGFNPYGGQSPFMGGGFNPFMGRGMGFNPYGGMGGFDRGPGRFMMPMGGMSAPQQSELSRMQGMNSDMLAAKYGPPGANAMADAIRSQQGMSIAHQTPNVQSDLYAQKMMSLSGGQGYGMPVRPSQEDILAQRAAGQGGANPTVGMTQQIPGAMQNAFAQMLQQQQAVQGGALPTASQSVSPMAGLGGLGIAGLLG